MGTSNTETGGITRRGFLGAAAATGALAALGLAGCAPQSATSASGKGEAGGGEAQWVNAKPGSIDKTIDTDVVIVGGGMSGTCCMLKAAENGLRVTLVDKIGKTGGATNYNVDTMFAMGDAEHARLRIESTVSPVEYVQAELEHGQYRNDGDRWWDVIDASPEYVEWMKSYGLEFTAMETGGLTLPFFKLAPLMFAPGEGGGKIATDTLSAAAQELGAEIMLNTEVTSLIQGEDGAVTGLYATSEEAGNVQINAAAVVLATGGFGSNPKLWKKAGMNADNMTLCGVDANQGDGYQMAVAAGGMDGIFDSAPMGQNLIPAFPGRVWNDPVNGNFGLPLMAKRIEVNQDAKRFMNEDYTLMGDPLGHPLATMNNAASYVMFDQAMWDEQFAMYGDAASQLMEAALSAGDGTFFKCDTVAECAESMGLDAQTLEATVNDYNAMCDSAADTRYGKAPMFLQKLEAPFYIGKYQTGITVYMGGIHTSSNMEVVDIERNPIPGLYAIGVDGCSMYRNFYTFGGGAMGHNVYSGRKAADVIAAKVKA